MPLMLLRLVALARHTLRVARWGALATVVAGAIVLTGEWEVGRPAEGLVLTILCLGPGLVLVHLVSTLASIPQRVRFGPGLPSRSNVLLLGVGITYLLRPWYWTAVLLSLLGGVVLVPLALLTVLGLR